MERTEIEDPAALACFSATTTEAGDKFVDAARGAGAAHERIQHRLSGPGGEPLCVDVAQLGPAGTAAALLVLSGTHGVEGFAGSAIQTALLRRHVGLPDHTMLLLVHLINPWGMAWNRREDDENIDLFRNLLYLDNPVTPDPLFDVVDDAMDLANFPQHTPEREMRVREQLVARYGGPQRLIAAIRRGQHHRPKSMSYHGDHASWSRQVLRDVLTRRLAGCRRLAVLDIHTGFGAYGGALVMTYDPPGDRRHERIRRWFDGDVYVPGDDADIPPHARSPYGFIEEWVPGIDVTAAIIEFGTFPPDDYRDVFPANHYHHVYGDPRSPDGLRVGERYRRYFYPDEPAWQTSVLRNGLAATRRMLAGLHDWNAE
jgi:hypothetical protein